ncbi:hypothetical protein [Deinococcus xianganensis]|uniref:hypothetical protein n=1 Tax=Deinococcus xianganensis TaxID=1507289 RepID=UPI001925D0BF|nr:hypothetical protein [Deinococcus xianganensis]
MPEQSTTNRPTNISRTWQVELYGSWGDGPSARAYMGSRIITLTADVNGDRADTVDGQPVSSEYAASLLNWAKAEGRVQLLDEVCSTPPVPTTIGKARAADLHKIMGLLGLKKPEHYALCTEALGEAAPRLTLADLTDADVKTVWSILRDRYPQAEVIAARLARHTRGHAA